MEYIYFVISNLCNNFFCLHQFLSSLSPSIGDIHSLRTHLGGGGTQKLTAAYREGGSCATAL